MYVDRAKELGMTALAFSEHGNIYNWYEKKTKIEEAGMKYVHGIECYLTASLQDKVRDNYHCVLLAKNKEGFQEINRLVSKSYDRNDGHFYYVPRIHIDELLNTSNNIIVTSACLGGLLNKADEDLRQKYIDFMSSNKDRCFLEIQHHIVNDQIVYNQYLNSLSERYDIKLVSGTDTHNLNKDLAQARLILQRAKNTFFNDESEWDLTFKSYDELLEVYKAQNSLPLRVVEEAIDNTNLIESMIEPFEIDMSPKYPKLYENSTEKLREIVYSDMASHPYVLKKHKKEDVISKVEYELDVFNKTNMEDFILFQKYVRDYEKDNDIHCGVGRGSITGSLSAYITGITEIDPIEYDLNFFRFANPSRQSNADIDTDYSEKDRESVRNFLFNNKNIKTAEIITFGTIAVKGAVRDVGRALEIPLEEIDAICKQLPKDEKKNEYLDNNTRKKYPELCKWVDLLTGVIVSAGTHPSGILCADRDIESEIGLSSLKNTEYSVSSLDMRGLDSCWWTKLDILG